MDPIAAARMGMMFATRKLEGAADQVARFGGDGDVDLPGALVDAIQAKTAFKANVQVVRIADEMWRSLLDIQRA